MALLPHYGYHRVQYLMQEGVALLSRGLVGTDLDQQVPSIPLTEVNHSRVGGNGDVEWSDL